MAVQSVCRWFQRAFRFFPEAIGGIEAFMTWHTTKDIRGAHALKNFNGFQLLLFVAKMQGCKQTCFSLSKFKWKEIGEKIEKSIDDSMVQLIPYQFPFEQTVIKKLLGRVVPRPLKMKNQQDNNNHLNDVLRSPLFHVHNLTYFPQSFKGQFEN